MNLCFIKTLCISRIFNCARLIIARGADDNSYSASKDAKIILASITANIISIMPQQLAEGEVVVPTRDFGSFFSSNVDQLIHQSEAAAPSPPSLLTPPQASYKAPELPFPPHVFDAAVPFGKPMRDKHFHLEVRRGAGVAATHHMQDCTFLNHGAFGGVIKQATEALVQWMLHSEVMALLVTPVRPAHGSHCRSSRCASMIDSCCPTWCTPPGRAAAA